MSALLSCHDLAMRFRGLTALDDLNLDIRRGEILGLLGPNGSGKTTFFNVVTGVYRASGGRIEFESHDISKSTPQAVYRAGIARTFQRSRLCLPLTIFDNIMIGNARHLDHRLWFNVVRRRQLRRQYEACWEEARELLTIFNKALGAKLLQAAASVSMIDRRRIEVCRALVSRPKLLLLDEPSMGLAPLMVEKIFEVIRAIAAEGVTLLLVEQNARLALESSHRGYVLDGGLVTLSGPARSLLGDPRVREAYLGE